VPPTFLLSEGGIFLFVRDRTASAAYFPFAPTPHITDGFFIQGRKSKKTSILCIYIAQHTSRSVNAILSNYAGSNTCPGDRRIPMCSSKDLAVEDKEDQAYKHNDNARCNELVRRHAKLWPNHPRKPLTPPTMACPPPLISTLSLLLQTP
jgi:hypothetical protein